MLLRPQYVTKQEYRSWQDIDQCSSSRSSLATANDEFKGLFKSHNLDQKRLNYAEDDAEIKALLEKLKENYPLQNALGKVAKYSASQCAVEKKNVVDPPTCIMIERHTTSMSWPPDHSISCTTIAENIIQPVYDSLFRPALFEITMTKADVIALADLADHQTIEQALRSQLDDVSNCKLEHLDNDTQAAFFDAAPKVREVSEDAEEKRRHGRDLNEAETRPVWDRLNEAIFGGGIALGGGAVIETIAERDVKHARNDLLDEAIAMRTQATSEKAFKDLLSLRVGMFANERQIHLSAQFAQLTRYDLTIPEAQPEDNFFRVSALKWTASNAKAMAIAVHNAQTRLSGHQTKYTDATTELVHVEARALRSFEWSRIDAGALLTIPGFFPASDRARVDAFNIVSPVPAAAPASERSQSQPVELGAAIEDDFGSPEDAKEAAYEEDLLEYSERLLQQERCALAHLDVGIIDRDSDEYRDSIAGPSDALPPAAEAISSSPEASIPAPTTKSSLSAPDVEGFLPFIFLFLIWEFKRDGWSILQVMNQGRFALMNKVKYLGCLGVFELPVFAIVTLGFKGHLLMAWGTPSQTQPGATDVFIADTNCPHWDLCDRSQALRLAIFLLNMRQKWCPRAAAVVEKARAEFVKKWGSGTAADRRSFDWTMAHQKKEKHLMGLKDRIESEKDADELLAKLIERKEELKVERKTKAEEKKAAKEAKMAIQQGEKSTSAA
ncbi:hypothetical protein HDZ31DRAFT_66301 [Schizophyllum fasciatum]